MEEMPAPDGRPPLLLLLLDLLYLYPLAAPKISSKAELFLSYDLPRDVLLLFSWVLLDWLLLLGGGAKNPIAAAAGCYFASPVNITGSFLGGVGSRFGEEDLYGEDGLEFLGLFD